MMITQLPRGAWAPRLEVAALMQKAEGRSQGEQPIDFSKWAEKEADWRADLELQFQANLRHLQSIQD
eukprot:1014870-Rhodomonas_salina.1